MRGWTYTIFDCDIFIRIFPADAGVNLVCIADPCMTEYIPRGCGGEPLYPYMTVLQELYSPRMRGWTPVRSIASPTVTIFPADAGVNLIPFGKYSPANDIPRGCGGEPLSRPALRYSHEYSPRMRGWTFRPVLILIKMDIFPADAGVNLLLAPSGVVSVDIPRGCGGEPMTGYGGCCGNGYSPRMRGWTLWWYLE